MPNTSSVPARAPAPAAGTSPPSAPANRRSPPAVAGVTNPNPTPSQLAPAAGPSRRPLRTEPTPRSDTGAHAASSASDDEEDDDEDEETEDGDESGSESDAESFAGPSRRFTASAVAAAAPTPFNTMFDEYAYADADVDPESSMSEDDPLRRDPAHTLSTDRTAVSHSASGLASASGRRDRSSITVCEDHIPHSTRPVPAPLQVRAAPDNTLSPVPSSSLDSKLGNESSEYGGGRHRFNFFRRRQSTHIDRDTARLQQLGYDAVLGRDYTFWSSLGIAMLNLGFIQGTVSAVPGAYRYGGPCMMLVAWPISGILSMFLVSTLSELASAYPVAGGMASWAWKCARAGIGGERYWGWFMGAVVLGGHVGNLVLLAWQCVNIITGTIGLTIDYEPERWHTVLYFLAIVLVVGTVGNTAWASRGRYWTFMFILALCVWGALCISLLATGVAHRDYKNTQAISTHFTTTTGWSLKGYVYILGWQYCTIACGADVCAHMSEETQDPSRNVPKAMTWSIALTYLLAYCSIIILLVSVSPEDAEFMATQEFPVGHILMKAISKNGAVVMCSIIVIVMCVQMQAQLQAASRFVFAMARDRALPFSDHIKRTNEAKQPWIATILCLALWAPCACLLISSSSVIISVVTVGASTLSMLSYLVPVALYILAPRLDLQVEGRSAWSLRKFSRPVAVVGALFCLCVIIVQCLPSKRPVTVNNVSWSPVVIVGTLLISIITWKTYGNKHYSGPIRALTKWETGMELDLDSTLHPSTQRGRTDATTSLKLAVTPCYPETVPTVHVASAETVETNLSMGEWTSASFTTTEGGTESISDTSMPARRAAAGATATMGRVDEDDECQHQHHADGAEVLNPNDIDLEKGDYEDEGYYHTDKGGSGQSRHDEEKRL